MTEKHLLLSDDEFEQKVETCSLPSCYFTHEAHLRLAYIHIKKYGIKNASKNLCRLLANFDNKYGDGTKFNKTLTIASAKVMQHFIKKAKGLDFNALILEFPQLRDDFKSLLDAHYSFDIVNHEHSKTAYLEPDLLAFG